MVSFDLSKLYNKLQIKSSVSSPGGFHVFEASVLQTTAWASSPSLILRKVNDVDGNETGKFKLAFGGTAGSVEEWYKKAIIKIISLILSCNFHSWYILSLLKLGNWHFACKYFTEGLYQSRENHGYPWRASSCDNAHQMMLFLVFFLFLRNLINHLITRDWITSRYFCRYFCLLRNLTVSSWPFVYRWTLFIDLSNQDFSLGTKYFLIRWIIKMYSWWCQRLIRWVSLL